MSKYPFEVEYNSSKDKNMRKIFEKSYDINRKYFKMDIPKFKIKIWYDRQKFNEKLKLPSESKYHAHAGMQTKTMHIMSPSISKIEDHNFNKEFFKSIIIHEFCHRFFYKKWKITIPIWITEGFACMIAKQEKFLSKKEKILPLSKMHYYKDWIRKPGYWQAYSLTKFSIRKYGKDKLNNLLSVLRKRDNYTIFSKKFKKIYGITPKEFQQEWLKQKK